MIWKCENLNYLINKNLSDYFFRIRISVTYSHGWQNGPCGTLVNDGSLVSGQSVNSNMPCTLGKRLNRSAERRHAQRSWLKKTASLNMYFKSRTEDVFQVDKSWLNNSAPLNMLSIARTDEVSHAEISWLNDVARSNMFLMIITEDVSHDDRSWLNDDALRNM